VWAEKYSNSEVTCRAVSGEEIGFVAERSQGIAEADPQFTVTVWSGLHRSMVGDRGSSELIKSVLKVVSLLPVYGAAVAECVASACLGKNKGRNVYECLLQTNC
jgi:hypothetical protein